jgi:hypothetical protein
MLHYSLSFIGIVAICMAALRSVREYQTYFTPWTMFLAVEVFLLHFLSIFSASMLGLIDSEREFSLLVLCSALYIIGYALAFWIRSEKANQIAFKVIDIIPDVRSNFLAISASLLLFAFGMFCLVYFGQAGLLWFSDPRLAYISFRGATGDGALYALAQWTLMTATAVCIFSAKLKTWRVYIVLLIFVGLAYFLGSKQIMLNIFIFALFVFERTGRKISAKTLVFYFFILASIFIALLLESDVGGDFSTAGYYFSEYAVNTMRIFSPHLGEMFLPGEFVFSNLWAYVPRFLFPDKPYEYGQVLINSVLFPGAAEQGATPGLLYWSPYYLESGALGVFVFGLLRGFLEGSFFQALRHLSVLPLKILLAFSLSITPMFLFAPPLYQYVFVLMISAVIRVFNFGSNRA